MKSTVLLLSCLGLMPALSYAQTAGEPKPDATEKISIVVSKQEAELIEQYRTNTITLTPSTTQTFKATVLTTNFIVPVVRFNAINSAPTNNQKGNVSLFNSIGAGLSYTKGRLELTTDKDGKIINREMDNTFGAQLGFLFAANAGTNNDANIFAPTISIMALNFHLGLGYELGSVAANEDRLFYTLAYGIPVSKLVRGGFYVLKKTPLPINTSNGFN